MGSKLIMILLDRFQKYQDLSGRSQRFWALILTGKELNQALPLLQDAVKSFSNTPRLKCLVVVCAHTIF